MSVLFREQSKHQGIRRIGTWPCRATRYYFFFQAEDGIRDVAGTGVQTCALPISFVQAARSLITLAARRSWFDEMVRRITAPTLLVQGDRDRLVAAAASRRLAGLRPDWSFELFADVGHVPQLEEPARFVDSVERWLGERAPAAATP